MNEIENLKIYIKIRCLCTNSQIKIIEIYNKEKSNFIKCNNCESYQHIKCISPENNMKKNYICYNCQLKIFDPFIYHIQNILPPVKVLSSPYSDNEKSIYFSFNQKTIKKNQFIILQIFKLSETGFTFEYPKGLTLILNNETLLTTNKYDHRIYHPIVFKMNELITNKHYKRIKGVIYSYFKIGEGEKNLLYIKLSKNHNKSYNFLFIIDLIEVIEDDNLIIAKTNKYSDINILKKIIYESESDLSVTEEFNLIDIYSGVDFITLPARGRYCKHLSCFDFKKYLFIDRSAKKFLCPICKRKIGLPYIDLKMKEIIDNCISKGIKKININSNYEILEEFYLSNNGIM